MALETLQTSQDINLKMKKEQERAPLFEALRDYLRKNMAPFHTPGHKQGNGIDPEFLDLVGKNIFGIDLTELPEVDNLHDPDGVIKEAHELAADAYGADYSFFQVNGSTGGNNAMIMSVCDPGDKIIIPRNAHKSVIGGIILSGAVPIYVQPVWDIELGIAHGITPDGVEEALKNHPEAKGVLVVNPTYYGSTTDIKQIVQICHRYGKPCLVDEAHGPHLKFHPYLPISALEAGADMVIQSTHKIISGMTQSSILHIKEGLVNVKRVRNVLQILQTTSPSYVLMASLDVARRQMYLYGYELLDRTIKLAQTARKLLNQIPGIKCFGKEKCGRKGLFDLDVTKLTINVSDLGISGFEFIDRLNEEYNIQSEMATLTNALEIVSIGNTEEDIDRLVFAIKDLSEKIRQENRTNNNHLLKESPPLPELPEAVITPREAFFAPTKRIPFALSSGQICAEIVAPYPPGIPILTPGERITQPIVEYLQIIHKHGGFINGPEDIRLRTIKVVV